MIIKATLLLTLYKELKQPGFKRVKRHVHTGNKSEAIKTI